MHGVGEVALQIKTTFYTQALLASLEKHRKAHIADYEKASEVYRSDVKRALRNLKLEILRSLRDVEGYDQKAISVAYHKLGSIQAPKDAAKMYDQYILVFSNSTEPSIELNMEEANAIFNDEWDWAADAKLLNSSYSSRY